MLAAQIDLSLCSILSSVQTRPCFGLDQKAKESVPLPLLVPCYSTTYGLALADTGAKMPGEVVDEVAEGQECAVCMEKRQNTKLVPCGHTDLCYGCVLSTPPMHILHKKIPVSESAQLCA